MEVRLGKPGEPVDVALLQIFFEELRALFKSLLMDEVGDSAGTLKLLGGEFRKGSFIAEVTPIVEGIDQGIVNGVADAIILGINEIENGTLSPTTTVTQVEHFRKLIQVGHKAGNLEIRNGTSKALINPQNELRFLSAFKERVIAGISVVGTIESVNIHAKPWLFRIYTKFDQESITCEMPDQMLGKVLEFLNKKSLLEVTGEGYFGPAGLFPKRIKVFDLPRELEFNAETLRSFSQSSVMGKPKESEVDIVERLRAERFAG